MFGRKLQLSVEILPCQTTEKDQVLQQEFGDVEAVCRSVDALLEVSISLVGDSF
jgi:hypothetical protein